MQKLVVSLGGTSKSSLLLQGILFYAIIFILSSVTKYTLLNILTQFYSSLSLVNLQLPSEDLTQPILCYLRKVEVPLTGTFLHPLMPTGTPNNSKSGGHWYWLKVHSWMFQISPNVLLNEQEWQVHCIRIPCTFKAILV